MAIPAEIPLSVGKILGGIGRSLIGSEVVTTIPSFAPNCPYPRKVIASIKTGDTIKQFEILIKNFRAHEDFINDLQTKPFFGVMTGKSVVYFPRDTVALVEDRDLTEEEIATEKLCGNSDLFEDPATDWHAASRMNPMLHGASSGQMTIANMPFPSNGNVRITGNTVIADPMSGMQIQRGGL